MVFIVNIQVEINAISFSISTYLSLKPRKGCIYLESMLVFPSCHFLSSCHQTYKSELVSCTASPLLSFKCYVNCQRKALDIILKVWEYTKYINSTPTLILYLY